MVRFKLKDERSYDKESDSYIFYTIELNCKSIDDLLDDLDCEEFIDKMECGQEDYCGVHDFMGGLDNDGVEFGGYHSYEIKNFESAAQKWYNYFKNKNLLFKNSEFVMTKDKY